MPTWCHMFNSTLMENSRVWFDNLPPESIDSYGDLKKAFLENYLQQKKCIKDPIELHNIKQHDGESIEDFVRKYKLESRDVKGATGGSGNLEPRAKEIVSTMEASRGANSTTGEDWSPRTLRFGLDEFRGRKVTVSVQRNYWNTTSQEISSSSVNGSRNAKNSSGRRSNYPKKQQIGFTGMRVGLQTKRDHPGSQTNEEGRNKLCHPLQHNMDIFAWKPADMTGVPRHITKYRLNIRKGCSPVRQKKRGQTADRNQAIQEKVRKLVEAGIIKEVHYHDWLSNSVMVKKHDGSWRMCVDLKDLNKACLKDGYPLPEIDWKTVEAKEAFKQMKQLIAELPMLTTPMEKEELMVYLAATKETVSAVLMTESEAEQMPIYFVSRALRGPELNYTSREKLVLALVHVSKRLKRYFQAHPIIVITDQPIQHVLSRPEIEGRLQKWKGSLDTLMEVEEELLKPWILFTDGSSCTHGSRAGIILTNPEWVEFTYALRFRFNATNNEAEYEALIFGLRIAEQMGVKNLQANVDSRLVANQVNETYVAKEVDMIRYLEKVSRNIGSSGRRRRYLDDSNFQIPRGGNPASRCEERKGSKT
uniref:Reverse transcriptase domain-containing protein n=1 Tax=Tanacetum cinerariifolium TaxID=118510 RepID=A0A699GRR2_TANCI|nr:reverse transcriptase domain-containing protein [Tanacetum cinerariifolium]